MTYLFIIIAIAAFACIANDQKIKAEREQREQDNAAQQEILNKFRQERNR